MKNTKLTNHQRHFVGALEKKISFSLESNPTDATSHYSLPELRKEVSRKNYRAEEMSEIMSESRLKKKLRG